MRPSNTRPHTRRWRMTAGEGGRGMGMGQIQEVGGSGRWEEGGNTEGVKMCEVL